MKIDVFSGAKGLAKTEVQYRRGVPVEGFFDGRNIDHRRTSLLGRATRPIIT